MWLNAACLGQRVAGRPHPNAVGKRLDGIFTELSAWIRGWLYDSDAAIGFAGSTTHAIDLSLMALPRPPRRIVITSMAHPTVAASARRMASWYSRMTSAPVEVEVVDLEAADSVSAGAIAECLLQRVSRLGSLDGSVVIVEHVSYLHGIRLPVGQVAASLQAAGVLQTIVDGAQAVGLWQPDRRVKANYAGCFHKYVSGPPGTAFLAVAQADGNVLPYHAGHSESERPTPPLPTLPAELWESCCRAVARGCPMADATTRVSRSAACMSALDEGLRPYTTSLARVGGTDVRSHIHAIDCGTSAVAESIEAKLAEELIFVGRQERWLRVSWSTEATPAGVGRSAEVIAIELRRHGVQA